MQHLHPVRAVEVAVPSSDTQKALVHCKVRPITCAKPGDPSDHLIGLVVAETLASGGVHLTGYLQDLQHIQADDGSLDFIDETETSSASARIPLLGKSHTHWNDLFDSWLGDVLDQTAQVLQTSFTIDETHDSVHPINGARLARVIPAILGSCKVRTWNPIVDRHDP